ncbi:unnamed protein product [Sphagnum jensenii]|uniref:EVE domain-containing protein n=1 Tax=Sphagnum jensenii TaxID=128206 RepID=A0ABP1AXU8_9BRYO
MSCSYWLLKTEPVEWGWEHQAANGGLSHWDGVRNAQAQKHLRSMRQGDLCFFYHSGKHPAVVGLVKVVRSFYPDPSDAAGKCGMVDVRELLALPSPVTLAVLKMEPCMANWILLRQPRLSVVPVSDPVWNRICELGELSLPLPDEFNSEIPPSPRADGSEEKKISSPDDKKVLKKKGARMPSKGDEILLPDVNPNSSPSLQTSEEHELCLPEVKQLRKKGGKRSAMEEANKFRSKASAKRNTKPDEGYEKIECLDSKEIQLPPTRKRIMSTEVPHDLVQDDVLRRRSSRLSRQEIHRDS